VDESPASTPDRLWLGTVVPKRHARRSVTRSLLKRQMRSALQQQADQLPAGLYVIRLRAPFDRSNFVSAVSSALRAVAAGELTQLVRDAAVRLARR
jgi:ribonuclease P protein component